MLRSLQTAFSALTIKLMDWHDWVPPSAGHSSTWNPQQMLGMDCVHWLPQWSTSQEQCSSGDDPNDLFTSQTFYQTCPGHLVQFWWTHIFFVTVNESRDSRLPILSIFLSHKFSFKHFFFLAKYNSHSLLKFLGEKGMFIAPNLRDLIAILFPLLNCFCTNVFIR